MSGGAEAESGAGLRLDKWLWFARFFKSRSLAARHCTDGHVRVNGTRVTKAHVPVRVGDVLTFATGARIRVVKVAALGARRGPAPEARLLYDDLDPPVPGDAATPSRPAPVAAREAGAGRPTKAERRAIDRLKGRRLVFLSEHHGQVVGGHRDRLRRGEAMFGGESGDGFEVADAPAGIARPKRLVEHRV